METQRQRKIGGVIQKDIVDILQKAAVEGGLTGTLISVSKVAVTSDLSIANSKPTKYCCSFVGIYSTHY